MSKNKKPATPKQHWEASKQKTIELAARQGRAKLKPWQVVYETIDRWSKVDASVAEERVKSIVTSPEVKNEIRDAARAVDAGTHEQINASSQAQFLIKVAIGEQKSDTGKVFERTAALKDGTKASITRIAEAQRMRTKELMTAPEPAKRIKNVSKQLDSSDDDEVHVLTGHVGAMSFNAPGTAASSSSQVVSKKGSSSGKDGVHVAQLKAQRESSHHVTLSRRLSKVMDEFQEEGAEVLKAFESTGFHENSNWQGFRIKDASDALAVAIKARHNFKKRQTKEKVLREPYVDPASASETYSEVRTESETVSDTYPDFVKGSKDYPDFAAFAQKHKIDMKSKAFQVKLESLEKALGTGARVI